MSWEGFAIAAGPVTAEQREPGECYWQCPNMNPASSRTGEDCVDIYERCNRAFEEFTGEDQLPECAIVEPKVSTGEQDA